jgi:hypothetical protein
MPGMRKKSLVVSLSRQVATSVRKAIEAKSKGPGRSKGLYGEIVTLRPPKQVHTSLIKMKFEDFNNLEIEIL